MNWFGSVLVYTVMVDIYIPKFTGNIGLCDHVFDSWSQGCKKAKEFGPAVS